MVGDDLNDAVVQVLLETHCHIKIGTTTLTSGTGDYELDTDILAIHKITGDDNVPWQRVNESDIEELRRADATSEQTFKYAVTGSNLIMVWPTPSSAQTATIYFVPRPTPMTSASHDPSNAIYGGIPAEHHKALEFYALWQGADFDDDTTSQQGDRYFGQYQLWLGKIKKGQKLKGGNRMPKATLGRRHKLRSDPSRT